MGVASRESHIDRIYGVKNATVAQLVEQTIRNRQVKGSNPFGGSLYLPLSNAIQTKVKDATGWMASFTLQRSLSQ
jgi:hypothetical protein